MQPAQQSLEAVVAAAASTENFPAVIRHLEGLAGLSEGDGLRHFTRLYLEVAQAIEGALVHGGFSEADFLRRLEVNFANLYFDALRRAFFPTEKARLGLAWAPLFGARGNRGIAPARFALAGMHAHLHHDLCLAIVRTCEERALVPQKGTPQHREFQRLGEVWHDHLRVLRSSDSTNSAHPGNLANSLAKSDDPAAGFSVIEARNAAWDNAEVLWHLRSSAELTADYLSLLERTVVAASRTLLAPA